VKTTFENKCYILQQLWMEHRDDENFTDFIEFNDIGLPLAFMIDSKIVVELTPQARNYIESTFAYLLEALEIEDTGYEEFDDMLDESGL
jgi:hypothetical protein